MNRFMSAFAQKIEACLTYRRARGFKEETHLGNLLRFDKFSAKHYSESNVLTPEIVFAWLDAETQADPRGLPARGTSIRQLGLYLVATLEDAFVLPEKFNTNSRGFIPYNFTDDELTRLFREIDRLQENKAEPFLTKIAPVLFRLIYTCGLRPNEGRDLLCDNIDLKSGVITIINTKNHKDRLIVMSDDMRKLCKSYAAGRVIFAGDSPYFFPSYSGSAFTSTKISTAFKQAWATAMCSQENPIPPNVRVYDLRHRFASACLNRWLDEKRDMYAMLPYLREYMGHSSLQETEYYIHILPENLAKSPAIDWDKFNNMFPEVAI